MPLGLIARLRLHRRPAALVAAGLMGVQVLLAGLVLAHAALLLTPGVTDFAVICHGSGAAASDNGTAPAPGTNPHPCCESCAAAAPPATLPEQALEPQVDRGPVLQSLILWTLALPIAPRAVRAGLSQAPPSLA
jgi:hypothetical protein